MMILGVSKIDAVEHRLLKVKQLDCQLCAQKIKWRLKKHSAVKKVDLDFNKREFLIEVDTWNKKIEESAREAADEFGGGIELLSTPRGK